MNMDNVQAALNNIAVINVELEGLSKTIEAVAEGAGHLEQDEISTILFFLHNTLDGLTGQLDDQLVQAKRVE